MVFRQGYEWVSKQMTLRTTTVAGFGGEFIRALHVCG
jgi:hypothetical protein